MFAASSAQGRTVGWDLKDEDENKLLSRLRMLLC